MKVCPNKLNKLRINQGWSQERLADISSLSLRTVQRIEAGENASLESQLALSRAFNVSPSELAVDSELRLPNKKVNSSGLVGLGIVAFCVTCLINLAGGFSVFVDIPTLLIVLPLAFGLLIVSTGFTTALNTVKGIKYLVVMPQHLNDVQPLIPNLKWLSYYTYVAGAVSTLFGLFSLAFIPLNGFFLSLAPGANNEILVAVGVMCLGFLYSVLLVELLIRPLKHKLERLLIESHR